jgi:hypothetical protein
MIIFPRQAQDKHRESTQKQTTVFLGDGMSYTSFRLGWHNSNSSDDTAATTAEAQSSSASSVTKTLSLSTTEGSTTRFDVSVANVGERHGRVTVLAMWRPIGAKNAPVSQLFLCLSQACLSKMIVCIYKIAPKSAFFAGHHTHLQQKLFAFDGLVLNAGGAGKLSFDLPVDKLAVADENGAENVFSFLAMPFYTFKKTEYLPRQARDKHRNS